ncbi:adenosylcobinamide-GDP ribazoletransferase [Thauera linaloolentis]|uniref:Adenosylcobinamide-GDP ribazoletransferase n=1 Tax=Thauera linaloolentis (strain DSM 12138 / JCM 21573 / CCUG 41526 / CIP 105981 / IAM 15112 / NBRC 102519 / 47Lol) TaxID=1123367 RepID=N6YQ31_THAL4|nr:adenosylcobinamide-GDP ribazoletransferase [Thauera linaloolentis]ENO84492.1 cobalamin synthase [Thauera linaloolentis 47Lol = DSM 12138]MCM8564523.1 adenosylcobinamide-GDP ribazoletransferase [Thauera linaloolentis]
MRYQLELFLTALGFFTRLPVPAWVPWSADRLRHAARYLALVGWVVGLAGAAGYLAFSWLLPPALAIILSMALTVRITGAFHEDGFADTCDGLGGGWDKAQVLAIMKDSRIGSYGAIGVALLLLAKAAALLELAKTGTFGADGLPAGIVAALLVAHPLSRLAATSLVHLLPYARADGSGKSAPVAQRLTPAGLAIAGACGLLPLALLTPTEALAAVAATAAVTAWCARLFMRRLGGHTGDLLGATQQLAELACYAGLLAAPRLASLIAPAGA